MNDMEKFLAINAKLHRNKADTGYVLTLFINDSLLKACKGDVCSV
jgi:hypothetical protein